MNASLLLSSLTTISPGHQNWADTGLFWNNCQALVGPPVTLYSNLCTSRVADAPTRDLCQHSRPETYDIQPGDQSRTWGNARSGLRAGCKQGCKQGGRTLNTVIPSEPKGVGEHRSNRQQRCESLASALEGEFFFADRRPYEDQFVLGVVLATATCWLHISRNAEG